MEDMTKHNAAVEVERMVTGMRNDGHSVTSRVGDQNSIKCVINEIVKLFF